MLSRTTTLTLLLALLVSGGCKEPPQIATHRVPKSQSGIEDFREGNSTESPQAPSGERFEAPEGWTRGKSNPMFPTDKFLKSFDGEEVTLSIMSLPSSNGWVPNVKRWLGQVGMQKTDEEIRAMTVELKVDEISSQKVKLIDNKDDSQAIIGIMTVKGSSAWFIKMMGQKSAIEAAESEFDAYVKTLSIP